MAHSGNSIVYNDRIPYNTIWILYILGNSGTPPHMLFLSRKYRHWWEQRSFERCNIDPRQLISNKSYFKYVSSLLPVIATQSTDRPESHHVRGRCSSCLVCARSRPRAVCHWQHLTLILLIGGLAAHYCSRHSRLYSAYNSANCLFKLCISPTLP